MFNNKPNKKIMSPAGGLGHKQAGGFAIIACLFVPHI
jgi:nanoRNase/pAp phosphatase (c-di-AMP/oligoRNAs hydrolase)